MKAADRRAGRTIAWVLGGRDAPTFQQFYNILKSLREALFYTGHWAACAQVLSQERHIMGTVHTHAIERVNANTRHHLARMTRQTKMVSKSQAMVHAALKWWCALNVAAIFEAHQAVFLSIFKSALSGMAVG
jgi:insertion element IS1 protein InsB